ncbi:LapA family protein [Geodermatophilus sp. SYSU D00710]
MADRPATSSPQRRAASLRPGQVVALVLAVVAVVFIVQNRERLTVDLFTVDVSAPVWLILTIMVLLGTAVGWLLRSRR